MMSLYMKHETSPALSTILRKKHFTPKIQFKKLCNISNITKLHFRDYLGRPGSINYVFQYSKPSK